jgi:hypothetical protein
VFFFIADANAALFFATLNPIIEKNGAILVDRNARCAQ